MAERGKRRRRRKTQQSVQEAAEGERHNNFSRKQEEEDDTTISAERRGRKRRKRRTRTRRRTTTPQYVAEEEEEDTIILAESRGKKKVYRLHQKRGERRHEEVPDKLPQCRHLTDMRLWSRGMMLSFFLACCTLITMSRLISGGETRVNEAELPKCALQVYTVIRLTAVLCHHTHTYGER